MNELWVEAYLWLVEPLPVPRWLAYIGVACIMLNLSAIAAGFWLGSWAKYRLERRRRDDDEAGGGA